MPKKPVGSWIRLGFDRPDQLDDHVAGFEERLLHW